MRSRRLLLPLGFGLLLASAVTARRPARPARAVQADGFRVHPVAGAISYIEGAGGNIGVLAGETGLLLVDDQLENARAGVLETVASISDAPVEFLLNTHWHGDHTGNNLSFGESTILAHANVRRRLAGDPTVEGRRAADTPELALPDVTFQESVTLHFAGERIELVHFGHGHTDGDAVVFFETSGVVHMGDLFFSDRFPFIDLDSGGSVEGYAAAVGAALERIEAARGDGRELKVIPGHGPLATPERLAAFHGMLQEAIERVREALAAGWSVDEMVENELLGDLAETWGDPGRFLGILARDLAR